jgi:hypothetical protein
MREVYSVNRQLSGVHLLGVEDLDDDKTSDDEHDGTGERKMNRKRGFQFLRRQRYKYVFSLLEALG